MPTQVGDWRVNSVMLKDDGTGGTYARVRITYTGQDTSIYGAHRGFKITVFKDGKAIAHLDGESYDLAPGATGTFTFIDQDNDKFVWGPYSGYEVHRYL